MAAEFGSSHCPKRKNLSELSGSPGMPVSVWATTRMGWSCSQNIRTCGSERMIESAAARLRLSALYLGDGAALLAAWRAMRSARAGRRRAMPCRRRALRWPLAATRAAAWSRLTRPRRQRPARRQGSPQRAPSAHVIFQPFVHWRLIASGSVRLRGTRRPKTQRSNGQRPGGIAPAKRRINWDYAEWWGAWPDARPPGGLQRGICRYGAAGKTHAVAERPALTLRRHGGAMLRMDRERDVRRVSTTIRCCASPSSSRPASGRASSRVPSWRDAAPQ